LSFNCEGIANRDRRVRSKGFELKPVIIGPLTYFIWVKAFDTGNKLRIVFRAASKRVQVTVANAPPNRAGMGPK